MTFKNNFIIFPLHLKNELKKYLANKIYNNYIKSIMKKINLNMQPDDTELEDVQLEHAGLYMSKALKARLKQIAIKNARSLNQQAILYLSESVAKEQDTT